MTADTLRNATLGDLAEMLTDQRTRKLDAVVPATKIHSEGGLWVVDDVIADIDDEGVTSRSGAFRPTEVADGGLAEKLGIPRAYLRRLRDERVDLYDANVNGWLSGRWGGLAYGEVENKPDPRSFLVRTFTDPEGGSGVARAFLSDRYRIVDHLDVLTAALEGIRESGVETEIRSVDLTDKRMYVRIAAPSVAVLAPKLLEGYTSPYNRLRGADNPVVFAGFVLANSETGYGKASLTPRIEVQICSNGMTITRDALSNVHLGGRMEEGVIQWSQETQRRNLDLVMSQAKDAVATFLTPEYVADKVDQLIVRADIEVSVKGVETITNQLSFGAERTAAVLDAFVRGGQTTLGGVAQAITAAAQRIPDADEASDMEDQAAKLLLAA